MCVCVCVHACVRACVRAYIYSCPLHPRTSATIIEEYYPVHVTTFSLHFVFRLEGNPPGVKMVGGVPGFQTPQLPRPGQKVAKKNALKIEK